MESLHGRLDRWGQWQVQLRRTLKRLLVEETAPGSETALKQSSHAPSKNLTLHHHTCHCTSCPVKLLDINRPNMQKFHPFGLNVTLSPPNHSADNKETFFKLKSTF